MAYRSRPLIGINTDYVVPGKGTTAQLRITSGYADSVFAAGGLPVILPPLGKDDEFEDLLDRLTGIVFVGGLDLDPRRSNLPTHPTVTPMHARREESDRLLMRLTLERQLPILAIGVGMQQLNVALGGTLFLHLPEEMPKSMPHFDPTGGPHRHLVLLEPGTRIDEIYGGGELRVNSCHHQGVKTLGNGLRVGAKSPDEVIESIESTDPDWFCVGVQWHPESETASALDMQVFEAFVQACVKQAEAMAVG
jgi:putative glutamine amidotransferase